MTAKQDFIHQNNLGYGEETNRDEGMLLCSTLSYNPPNDFLFEGKASTSGQYVGRNYLTLSFLKHMSNQNHSPGLVPSYF